MINLKKFTKVGIVGYGAYVPPFRLGVEEIAKVWGKEAEPISNSLGVRQKAVCGRDEDCLTMAVEASLQALKMTGIEAKRIGACFLGSESFPYAVKATTTTLSKILGMDNDYFTSDLQFACKAATTGVQIVAAMLEAGLIDYGLVVGSDKAQSQPGDVLEYTAGCAAAAFILGSKKTCWLARLEYTSSFNSDTPDFWRRDGQNYPSHGGRFTGKPAYFKHVYSAAEAFFKKTGKKPQDFDYAVFHSPNKKFPLKAASRLGFGKKQLQHSLLVEEIGNPYSASCLVSLVNVLDNAESKENIFLTSYGSGAGSDSFSFKTTKELIKKRKRKEKLEELIRSCGQIDYASYLRKMGII